ncbi:hypothetical protein [Kutzneria sp. CA-103260]|uniref:hypothetical protein n=1 Tax=Kutzneria sp. CA-103260 TaxID=2802641 RepID=UPI001BA47D49|nr:hypothetical protein [Kutzneria sp. CA-103260]QUQ66570.1 hypothetical protein JJ691_42980 [Kutzneria sp. CA-103260]
MIRYLLADLFKSQRWLPPVFVYLAVAGILYGGDPGTPRPPYGVSEMALFPLAAWLTVVLVNNEDPVQRHVTLAAVGGWRRLLGGLVGAAAVLNGGLVLVATFVPALIHHHPYAVSDVALGFVAHVIAAVTGISLGLLCARPMIPTTGWSLVAVVGVALALLVANQLPPVGAMAHLLFDTAPVSAPAVAVQVAVAAVVGAACVGVVYRVGRRRF